MNNDDENNYLLRKKILKGICLFYFIAIIIICIISSIFTTCYQYSFNEEIIGYYYNYEDYYKDISNLIDTKEKKKGNIDITYYIVEQPKTKIVYTFKNNLNKFNYNIVDKYIQKDYTIYKVIINDEIILFCETEQDAVALKNELEEKTEKLTIKINKEAVKELPTFYTELDKNNLIEENKKKEVSSRSGASRYSNKIIENYSYISQYFKGQLPNHSGIDLAAKYGTQIYAWKDGIVTFADWSGNYGNFICIEHFDGTISRYAHLSKYNCEVGDTVLQQECIGFVGSSGKSTGSHLHFEIIINNSFVNPLDYINY